MTDSNFLFDIDWQKMKMFDYEYSRFYFLFADSMKYESIYFGLNVYYKM